MTLALAMSIYPVSPTQVHPLLMTLTPRFAMGASAFLYKGLGGRPEQKNPLDGGFRIPECPMLSYVLETTGLIPDSLDPPLVFFRVHQSLLSPDVP